MGLFDTFKIKMLLKKVKTPSNTREIKILPLNNYKSILIISDKNNISLTQLLGAAFANANFTILTTRDSKEDQSSGSNYTYHKSDLGFGNLKNERLIKLLNLNFDLVIDFSNKTKELDYFVKNSKSTLKAGDLHASKNYLYDLLVDNIDSKTEFIDNIKRQINILSQK